MKSKKMKLVIVIFLGVFGIHKFIENNKAMGWIYLFTCGLCGIGWIFDVVKCLLEVVNEKIMKNTNIIIHNNYDNNSSNEFTNENIELKKTSTIAKSINLTLDNIFTIKEKFIALDFETTGLDAYSDRIIEIGAVIFESGIPVSKFNTLVNPGRSIPLEATRVNHITNEMIQSAPHEKKAFQKFVEFMEPAFLGNVIICAHNASFDIKFLINTMNRLGCDCNIKYIDTLTISRNVLKNEVMNHKQNTIAKYFSIVNEKSHRAVSDAETCGKILNCLIPLYSEELEKQTKYMEKCVLTDIENVISSYFQKLIEDNFGDLELFGFRKNASGYINMCYLYNILRYKYTKNGFYIILPKKVAKNLLLKKEDCSISEGGSDNIRVFFNNPKSLELINAYIIDEYKKLVFSAKSYMKNNEYCKNNAYEAQKLLKTFSSDEMDRYINIINQMELDKKVSLNEEIKINLNDININPVNNRVPFNQIKNLDDFSKGFDEGFIHWEKGEQLRKNNAYEESIKCYDKARYNGYDAVALYESYAMAYHSLKDYDNEIDILNEGIKRAKISSYSFSCLETRRNKAVQMIVKAKQNIELKKSKEQEKDKKRIDNVERQMLETIKKAEEKFPIEGKYIIQMNDVGNIIKEYISISEAVRETGINSKSIRNVANGIQKHAGGYVWKFKE